jgi:hypothetical protein
VSNLSVDNLSTDILKFGNLPVDNLSADILTFGNLSVDILMVCNLAANILTVINLTVGILMVGNLSVNILSLWNLSVDIFHIWQFVSRHFDGRQFGSRHFNAAPGKSVWKRLAVMTAAKSLSSVHWWWWWWSSPMVTKCFRPKKRTWSQSHDYCYVHVVVTLRLIWVFIGRSRILSTNYIPEYVCACDVRAVILNTDIMKQKW